MRNIFIFIGMAALGKRLFVKIARYFNSIILTSIANNLINTRLVLLIL